MGCLMSGGRGRVALWGRVRGDGGFIPAQLCCVVAYGSQWEGTREGTVRADSPSSAIWLSTRLIEWGGVLVSQFPACPGPDVAV